MEKQRKRGKWTQKHCMETEQAKMHEFESRFVALCDEYDIQAILCAVLPLTEKFTDTGGKFACAMWRTHVEQPKQWELEGLLTAFVQLQKEVNRMAHVLSVNKTVGTNDPGDNFPLGTIEDLLKNDN